VTIASDWDLDDSEDIEWTIDGDAYADWDHELQQLDCTNGNAVCLFARGLVFAVPARCKRLRICPSCRQWAWGRQYEHIGEHLTKTKIDRLWLAVRVTDRELSAITERRKKMGDVVNWIWVNTPEGRTYIATSDLTQLRGRRFPKGSMTNISVKEGLGILGDAYMRADAIRRQTCQTWKIPRRSFLLQFGARLRIQQAIAEAFGPDGNAWDSAKNKRLTSSEIIARFNEAYAAIN